MVDLPIYNKEELKKKYEKALIELREQISREKTLTMGMPKFVGIVRVIPAEIIHESMKYSKEIELIGMKIAMKYEIEHGRIPQDVSSENLGYDIKSTDKQGKKRYIEVKARADQGSVALTWNEWSIAHRFKNDYYLYVVLNAKTNPNLWIIRNPAENLKLEEKIEIVRYIIPLEQIKEKGMKNG